MLLIFLATALSSVLSLTANYTLDPPTLGSYSDFKLFVSFSQSVIGIEGRILVEVPSSAATESGSPLKFEKDQGGAHCEIDASHSYIQILNCTVVASQTLAIFINPRTMILPGDTLNLKLTNATKNPSRMNFLSQSLIVSTFDSEGLVEKQAEDVFPASIEPVSLEASRWSAQFENTVIGASNSALRVCLRMHDNFKQGEQLIIQFPADSQFFPFESSTLDAVWKVGATNGEAQVTIIEGPAFEIILIQGSAAPEEELCVTLNGIQNPVYLQDFILGVKLLAQDGAAYALLPQAPLRVDPSAWSPAAISETTVSLEGVHKEVNSIGTFRIQWTASISFSKGMTIVIGVPPEMSRDIKGLAADVSLELGEPEVPISTTVNATSITCSTTYDGVKKEANMALVIRHLRLPDRVLIDPMNFSFSVYDSKGIHLAEVGTPLALHPSEVQEGALLSGSISASPTTILETPVLILKFTTSNPVTLPGEITISIPPILDLKPSCKAKLYSKLLPCATVDGTISISLITPLEAGEAVSLSLQDSFTNPSWAVSELGSFTITTKIAGSAVDEIEISNPFQVEPIPFSNISLEFTPDKALVENPDLLLTIDPQLAVEAGDSIILNLYKLTDIKMRESTNTCQHSSISGCNLELLQGEQVIKMAVAEAFSEAIQVNISGFLPILPRYKTAQLGAASVRVYRGGEDKLAMAANLVSLGIGASQKSSSCSMKSLSSVNREATSLEVQVDPEFKFEDGDSVILSSDVQELGKILPMSAALSCSSPGVGACSATRDTISARVESTSAFRNNLVVDGFVNPPSTASVGPFAITVTDSQGRTVLECNSVSVSSSQGSPLSHSSLVLVQTTKEASRVTDYEFQFSRHPDFNDLPIWVKIELPECVVSKEGFILSLSTDGDSSVMASTNGRLAFVAGLGPEGIIMKIFDVVNPSEQCLAQAASKDIQLTTFLDAALTIEAERLEPGFEPHVLFTSNCNDFGFTGKCLECKEQSMVMMDSTGACLKQENCPEFSFPMGTNLGGDTVCYDCPEGCPECDSRGCLKCSEGVVLDRKCIPEEECGAGFILFDNTTCSKCSDQCQECGIGGPSRSETYDEDFCTVCNNSSSILFQGECLQSCPEGTEKYNDTCKPIASVGSLEEDRESTFFLIRFPFTLAAIGCLIFRTLVPLQVLSLVEASLLRSHQLEVASWGFLCIKAFLQMILFPFQLASTATDANIEVQGVGRQEVALALLLAYGLLTLALNFKVNEIWEGRLKENNGVILEGDEAADTDQVNIKEDEFLKMLQRPSGKSAEKYLSFLDWLQNWKIIGWSSSSGWEEEEFISFIITYLKGKAGHCSLTVVILILIGSLLPEVDPALLQVHDRSLRGCLDAAIDSILLELIVVSLGAVWFQRREHQALQAHWEVLSKELTDEEEEIEYEESSSGSDSDWSEDESSEKMSNPEEDEVTTSKDSPTAKFAQSEFQSPLKDLTMIRKSRDDSLKGILLDETLKPASEFIGSAQRQSKLRKMMKARLKRRQLKKNLSMVSGVNRSFLLEGGLSTLKDPTIDIRHYLCTHERPDLDPEQKCSCKTGSPLALGGISIRKNTVMESLVDRAKTRRFNLIKTEWAKLKGTSDEDPFELIAELVETDGPLQSVLDFKKFNEPHLSRQWEWQVKFVEEPALEMEFRMAAALIKL